MNPIVRGSQLRINPGQLANINNTVFGCPALDIALNCTGGHPQTPPFSQDLQIVSNSNWVPRMSTGLEVQVFLPIINAPFRVYWAYNPLRLDNITRGPVPITRDMFPPGAAGDFTFEQAARSLTPGVPIARAAQDVPLQRGNDVLKSVVRSLVIGRYSERVSVWRAGFATTNDEPRQRPTTSNRLTLGGSCTYNE